MTTQGRKTPSKTPEDGGEASSECLPDPDLRPVFEIPISLEAQRDKSANLSRCGRLSRASGVLPGGLTRGRK